MRGARGGVKVAGRPRLEIKVPVFVPAEGVPLLALERLQAATIVADFVRRQAVDREQAAVTLVSRDLFGGRAGRHSAHSGVGRMVTVLWQLGEKARGRFVASPPTLATWSSPVASRTIMVLVRSAPEDVWLMSTRPASVIARPKDHHGHGGTDASGDQRQYAVLYASTAKLERLVIPKRLAWGTLCAALERNQLAVRQDLAAMLNRTGSAPQIRGPRLQPSTVQFGALIANRRAGWAARIACTIIKSRPQPTGYCCIDRGWHSHFD